MRLTTSDVRRIGIRGRRREDARRRALWSWCFDESAHLARNPADALRAADETLRRHLEKP